MNEVTVGDFPIWNKSVRHHKSKATEHEKMNQKKKRFLALDHCRSWSSPGLSNWSWWCSCSSRWKEGEDGMDTTDSRIPSFAGIVWRKQSSFVVSCLWSCASVKSRPPIKTEQQAKVAVGIAVTSHFEGVPLPQDSQGVNVLTVARPKACFAMVRLFNWMAWSYPQLFSAWLPDKYNKCKWSDSQHSVHYTAVYYCWSYTESWILNLEGQSFGFLKKLFCLKDSIFLFLFFNFFNFPTIKSAMCCHGEVPFGCQSNLHCLLFKQTYVYPCCTAGAKCVDNEMVKPCVLIPRMWL